MELPTRRGEPLRRSGLWVPGPLVDGGWPPQKTAGWDGVGWDGIQKKSLASSFMGNGGLKATFQPTRVDTRTFRVAIITWTGAQNGYLLMSLNATLIPEGPATRYSSTHC